MAITDSLSSHLLKTITKETIAEWDAIIKGSDFGLVRSDDYPRYTHDPLLNLGWGKRGSIDGDTSAGLAPVNYKVIRDMVFTATNPFEDEDSPTLDEIEHQPEDWGRWA